MHIKRNLITSAALCELLGVAVVARAEAQGGYGGGRSPRRRARRAGGTAAEGDFRR